MVGVEIKGFDGVPSELTNVLDKKRQALFMRQLVMDIADLIKEYAPRDTRASHTRRHKGLQHLENSIHVTKLSDTRYQIRIEVPYAIYIEYGTRYINVGTINSPKAVVSGSGKRSFRPFIRPAVWQMMQEHGSLVEKAFFTK